MKKNPIKFISSCRLPTEWGIFTLHGFEDTRNNQEHAAITMGDLNRDDIPILTRIHSECLTGDALFSRKCDCGPQLKAAMQFIQKSGSGVIVYLRQEGRGIGLLNKIKAYRLQDSGMDTVEANLALGLPVDNRDFTIAKDILDLLDIKNIRLLTNNPEKIKVLKNSGINVVERIALHVGENAENENYLTTKERKLGHLFE